MRCLEQHLGKLEVNWHTQISQARSRRRERSHQGRECFQNKRTVDRFQKSALTERKQPEFTDNRREHRFPRRKHLCRLNHDVGVIECQFSGTGKTVTPVGLVAQQTLAVLPIFAGVTVENCAPKYNPRWGNGRSRAQWEKNPTCLASMSTFPVQVFIVL